MNDNLYEECLLQEKELQFETITQEEMLRLGLTIHENNKKLDGPLGILIKVNEKEVFSYYPDGTGEFHRKWLHRKANMVHMREMCTLRAFLELERNRESLEKDWLLNPDAYAACGGGFPIRLKNGCVVGSVCVSGLPHLMDHAAVVEGIRIYLGKNASEEEYTDKKEVTG